MKEKGFEFMKKIYLMLMGCVVFICSDKNSFESGLKKGVIKGVVKVLHNS
jgi:hypothetical protein